MSYDLFIGNYDKLMDGVYGSGLDVTNIFELLKDKKQLAKNLYLLSNPYATQQDADLIFDSAEELLEKIDKEFEEEVDDDEFDDVYDPDEGNLTPEEKKEKKRREKEEKKEEKESVRNEKKEEKERKKREREENKKRRKDEIKELKKVYTDEATERFYNEADEFKNELRKSVFVLSQQVKEVGTSLSLLVLSYSTAIPAIVIDVSPLSFNFPGAFDRLIQVIVDLIIAYTSFQKATQFLDKGFRVAPKILDNKSLSVLGNFLNPIVIALNALFKPLTLLYGLVKKLVEALKKIFLGKDKTFKKATKQLRKLGHLPNRRGNKRGDVYKTEPDENEPLKLSDGTPVTVWAKEEDDIEEILSLLDRFRHHEVNYKNGKWNGKRKWGTTGHVYAFREEQIEINEDLGIPTGKYDISDLLEIVESRVNELEIPIQVEIKDSEDIDRFVYDIELPDGTIIPNISEEGLEYFRSKYDLRII